MSEKINQYVKFIRNEQKRLNSSTVVAPRQLNEAVPFLAPLAIRGGAYLLKKGAEAYAKRQAAKAAAEKAASEVAKKAGEEAVKKGPEGLVKQGTRKVPTKPHYKPGSAAEPTPAPTVSPSAPQSLPKPKAEFKGEPLQVGPALVGAAGLVGGGAAIQKGMEQAKEVEAEKAPKPEAPTAKEPPKAAAEPVKQEPPTKPEENDRVEKIGPPGSKKDEPFYMTHDPSKDNPLETIKKLQQYNPDIASLPAENSRRPKPMNNQAKQPSNSVPADDEESEKYVSSIERRARTLKKEAVERLFSIKKPRI